jgi:hypothetical protein
MPGRLWPESGLAASAARALAVADGLCWASLARGDGEALACGMLPGVAYHDCSGKPTRWWIPPKPRPAARARCLRGQWVLLAD